MIAGVGRWRPWMWAACGFWEVQMSCYIPAPAQRHKESPAGRWSDGGGPAQTHRTCTIKLKPCERQLISRSGALTTAGDTAHVICIRPETRQQSPLAAVARTDAHGRAARPAADLQVRGLIYGPTGFRMYQGFIKHLLEARA